MTRLLRIGEGRPVEDFERIGALFGRSRDAAYVKFLWLKQRATVEAARKAADVSAIASMPRSLTAEIFGDPLPGRSALDQRSARA